ncbi:4'-phosphopantetheinyl transferase superfamily protein [Flavobacteriales bacterium]|jgi:phosphopantetheinyl transferase|nr:4'-phosphopantetheinyl transferase superfamily protein [Flavobacteriales bacterium]
MGIVLAIKYVKVVEKTDDDVLMRVAKHYPKRDIQGLSKKKIAEHEAVINCLHELLGSKDWWIEHEESGKPVLFISGVRGNLSISISHVIDQVNNTKSIAHAAVILLKDTTQESSRIGVDLVIQGDPRLKRIAGRVMRKEEIAGGRLEEVWACKEAMFKAFGPGLDFVKDLKVDFISNDLLEGLGRKWEVRRKGNTVVVLGPV